MSVGSNRQAGDLRDFVDELDALGEIKRFEGADCDLEIGALTEIMADRNGPAPLFEKIKGFPAGYRMLANPIGGRRRMALALGLDPHGTGIELLDQWRRNFREMKPIPPSRVNTGPVLENVAEGNDVDLARFPAPRWHEQDGGPYLGTGCSIITRDPDNGDVNIGTYRCMTQSRNTISVKMNKGKHGRLAMQKYHAAGKPCPLAISLGQNPQVYMASQLPVRWAWTSMASQDGCRTLLWRWLKVRTRVFRCPQTARWCLRAKSRFTSKATFRRRARSANGPATTLTRRSAKSPSWL
jgi:UbiD family decarboxylase